MGTGQPVCLPEPRRSDDAVPGRLHEHLTAVAANVGSLRRRLRAWLAETPCDEDTADDLVLATSEALENCVDHAYAGLPEPGTMTLSAALVDGDVVIAVCDGGRWRTPDDDPGPRGRGLGLIRSVATEAHVATDDDGTHVTIRLGLSDARSQGAAT